MPVKLLKDTSAERFEFRLLWVAGEPAVTPEEPVIRAVCKFHVPTTNHSSKAHLRLVEMLVLS